MEENAIELRNKAWKNTDRLPTWVRDREIALDQFYTDPKIAE